MDILLYVIAGAGVGFAVGLTGVGGGSLMTPILLLFGFPAHIAVGTDLIYAAVTKASGVHAHHRRNNVNWRVVRRLACGSLPASVVTVLILSRFFSDPTQYRGLLMSTLGVMLILTSVVLLFRARLQQLHSQPAQGTDWRDRYQAPLTVLAGVFLGICVTLSSVGAGAFGAAILMVLYPRLSPIQIIGTDLAHAVPLTLVAGLGHWELGNINYYLLGCLLLGSLPAIHLGTYVGRRLPARVMQSALASILFLVGLKYVFF